MVSVRGQFAGPEILPAKKASTDALGEINESLDALVSRLHAQTRTVSVLRFLMEASTETGNIVQLKPECAFLPVIFDQNNEATLLYQFVEAVDSMIDHVELKTEFPSLSYTQIAGAFAFLRKAMQFNARGIDMDALEEDILESNADFQAEVKRALADQEGLRVLDVRE
ncbi:MAG: hypothetical protein QOH93_1113 [Chloroflexia bacterium]|jgi:hypothetical protein|nr:hypothetical protein [Chloroflexia bacterium]